MEFVCGYGSIIHFHSMQIHGNFSGALHYIQMHGNSMFPGGGTQNRRILQCACLIIGPGKRNAGYAPCAHGLPFFRNRSPFPVHRADTAAAQGQGRLQGGVMVRGQNAYPSLPLPGHLAESHIRRLRSAGSKYNFRRKCAQQGGNGRTGLLHRLTHMPGTAVTGGRVEKPFF